LSTVLTSLDFLYLSLAFGFLILVGFLVYLILKIAQTLDTLQMVLRDVKDVTGEARSLKNQIKGKILAIPRMFFG
jgi:uncharacterized protein YoxC